jgi:flagellin
VPITLGQNIASLKAQLSLGKASEGLSKTFQRLSSGLRVNSAADDAAGLAVGTSLRTGARLYQQAVRNVNDGISLLAIADSALESLTGITTRIKELATQAANGVYSSTQRQALNTEATALESEYNRILAVTQYNGNSLLSGNGYQLSIQAGTDNSSNSVISATLGGAGITLSTQALLGYGDGTMGSLMQLPTGDFSDAVSGGDLNGDGYADLVSVGDDGYVKVFINNGNGTFKAVATYDAPFSTYHVTLADTTGTGRLDIIGVSPWGANVLINNGNGTFLYRAAYNLGGVYASYLNTGDVNKDGKLDFVTANWGDGTVSVVFGNGNGTFKAATSYLVSATAEAMELGLVDFNGDGSLDIAVNDRFNDKVAIALNAGNGTFGAFTSYASGGNDPNGMITADLNNDGKTDVIVGMEASNSFTVLLSNGNGTFNAPIQTNMPGTATWVKSGDIDRDGNIDVLSAFWNIGNAQIALGNGDGTFRLCTAYAMSAGISYDNEWIDLNNDGVLDAVTGDETADNLNIRFGTMVGQKWVTVGVDIDLTTQAKALNVMDAMDSTLANINSERAKIGAVQSRLSVAANTLGAFNSEYEDAASRILDADVAEEVANMTRLQILQQAAAAVLAQANQQPTLVLQLLRD